MKIKVKKGAKQAFKQAKDDDSLVGQLIKGCTGRVVIRTPFGETEIKKKDK